MRKFETTILFSILFFACAVKAREPSDLGFEYFNTVGRVQTEAKSVGWFAEICGESFPNMRIDILKAHEEWSVRNRAALSDLDAQYDVIERYWAALPERDRRGALTKQQMLASLEAQRPQFRKKLVDGDKANFLSMCSQYAGILRSARYDMEARRSAELKIIRQGPR